MSDDYFLRGSLLNFGLVSNYPHHDGVLAITLIVTKVREIDLKNSKDMNLIRTDFKNLSQILAARNEVQVAIEKGFIDDIRIILLFNSLTKDKIFLKFSLKGISLSEDLNELDDF